MKATVIKLLSTLLCLALLLGCAAETAPAETPAQDTGKSEQTDKDPTGTAENNIEQEQTPIAALTSDEIAQWATYFNTLENNGLLRFPYAGVDTDPDRLAPYLGILFYDIGDHESEFSEDEKTLLAETDLWMELDSFRLTREFMNDYLYEHFNSVVSAPWIPRAMSSILDQNFLTGELLFMDCSLFEIRTQIYPFAEFEYGILPCPIYEEGQDYASVIYFNNWAHLWTLPNMLENVEYAERMLEIMAVYSSLSGSTMDAYYERTIYLNAARDNGSREVLDVIRQSLVYDIALMYDWGGLEKMLERISHETSNPYAGAVNGIEASVNPKIEDTIAQLRDPVGNS